ncbi:MAG: ribosomal biogenesis protein [Thermoplasmata archaeon]|nr:ribosomal biogenesis protein [Thermoplasmata archaeon]
MNGQPPITLITRWYGVFVVEGERVIDSISFPEDPGEIAGRLKALSEGKILEEERELAGRHHPVGVTEERLTSLGPLVETAGAEIPPAVLSSAPDPSLLHQALLEEGRERLGGIRRDELLIQAVSAYEEMNRVCNLMYERLREWYGIHGHRLVNRVSPEKLAELVGVYGSVDDIRANTSIDVEKTASLPGEDLAAISSFALTLREAQRERERLEKYITRLMGEIAPNLSAVLGPILGARLISLAGGLERLASMPSSTVQVLGAENALFLHLKEGRRPPKHGIIFQHSYIHDSPPWQRGKIARAMAGKISIAARVDAATGRDISRELREEMERRIGEIREKYPSPPVKPSGAKGGKKRRGRGKGKKGGGKNGRGGGGR